MDYRNQASEFLQNQLILTLATSSGDVPWSCALEFVEGDNFSLYWQSNDSSIHSQNLAGNPRCSVSVTLLGSGNQSEGLQCSGTAQKVTDQDTVSRMKALLQAKRNKYLPEDLKAEERDRELWQFVPDKIFYLNEELLGYGRAEIQIQ